MFKFFLVNIFSNKKTISKLAYPYSHGPKYLYKETYVTKIKIRAHRPEIGSQKVPRSKKVVAY